MRALVSLNLLNKLRKRGINVKLPRILSLFLNGFHKFNKTELFSGPVSSVHIFIVCTIIISSLNIKE